jgi:hypothetical protein
MNTSTRRLLGGLAIAAVLQLGQGPLVRAATPSPSAAPTQPSGLSGNEMLSVQPSLIDVTAKPGTTVTAKMTVRAAAKLSVTISPLGLGQGTDGNMTSIPADLDTGGFSARTMVTSSPESLQMQPGDQVTVNVAITVPANVGQGSRYAILNITGLPPSPTGSANVGFGVQLGVSAIVHISDTPQVKAGEIKGITIGQSLPGQALPVLAPFLNTGNTHYGAIPNEFVATAILQDASGAQIGSATANGNNVSILPSYIRDLNLAMVPTKALVDGAKYHLEVGVGLKDGTFLDRKALDFTWSGGAAIGGTVSPVQTSSADPVTIIVAAVVGAAAVLVLFLIISRLRRRGRRDGGATTA